jgi:hypothetical protein
LVSTTSIQVSNNGEKGKLRYYYFKMNDEYLNTGEELPKELQGGFGEYEEFKFLLYVDGFNS